jgi:hypothetical protein
VESPCLVVGTLPIRVPATPVPVERVSAIGPDRERPGSQPASRAAPSATSAPNPAFATPPVRSARHRCVAAAGVVAFGMQPNRGRACFCHCTDRLAPRRTRADDDDPPRFERPRSRPGGRRHVPPLDRLARPRRGTAHRRAVGFGVRRHSGGRARHLAGTAHVRADAHRLRRPRRVRRRAPAGPPARPRPRVRRRVRCPVVRHLQRRAQQRRAVGRRRDGVDARQRRSHPHRPARLARSPRGAFASPAGRLRRRLRRGCRHRSRHERRGIRRSGRDHRDHPLPRRGGRLCGWRDAPEAGPRARPRPDRDVARLRRGRARHGPVCAAAGSRARSGSDRVGRLGRLPRAVPDRHRLHDLGVRACPDDRGAAGSDDLPRPVGRDRAQLGAARRGSPGACDRWRRGVHRGRGGRAQPPAPGRADGSSDRLAGLPPRRTAVRRPAARRRGSARCRGARRRAP